jgi:hypothetical protein
MLMVAEVCDRFGAAMSSIYELALRRVIGRTKRS